MTPGTKKGTIYIETFSHHTYRFLSQGWETDLPRGENRGPPRRKPVPRGENRQPRIENRREYLMLNIPCGEN